MKKLLKNLRNQINNKQNKTMLATIARTFDANGRKEIPEDHIKLVSKREKRTTQQM